jgi:hypothetical protein
MRRILLLVLSHFSLLVGNRLLADVVTLQDGRQISGSVESGNTQELHIKVGDQSETIDIHEVRAVQFVVSSPAPATAPTASKAAAPVLAAPELVLPQPNALFFKDGKQVAGRWWSVDPTDMHFLVDNQLRHYPRADVSAVTFGNATLPSPVRSMAPPTVSAQSPANPAPLASTPQPARPPTLARPPQPPTLTRSANSSSPSAPSRGLSQPEEIGMVYFWNGKVLIPLERNQAVEHKSGSTQYFEMSAPSSSVRLNETTSLVFILRLPPGVNPTSYMLFQLVTVNGSRRTRSQPGRGGGLMTWPVDIEKNHESSLITYALTVRDLPTGEWSFSPASTNDGYSFGVDSSAPGQ